jgi:uncharacterized membrane protein YhaH (DUF805 family)
MTVTQYSFSFYGRIGRGRWWFGQLHVWLILMVSFLVVGVVNQILSGLVGVEKAVIEPVIRVLIWAAIILAIYSHFAIDVKRCHDRGWSGWFLLVSLIPFAGIWVLVELAILPGEKGFNKFGEDPQREPV